MCSAPPLPLARRLVAVCCVAASAAATASPAAGDDPMAQLLHERGLLQPAITVEAPDPGFVGRVRDRAGDIILSAMNFLGVPYRRGGNGVDGFDCSGFTRHIFESTIGFVLPRKVDDQARAPGLVKVRREELKPGDLVFFNTLRRTFSHVGIYIGDGKFIHSPRSGATVRVEDMRGSYWNKRFTGARRAEVLHAAADEASTAAAMASSVPAATVVHQTTHPAGAAEDFRVHY